MNQCISPNLSWCADIVVFEAISNGVVLDYERCLQICVVISGCQLERFFVTRRFDLSLELHIVPFALGDNSAFGTYIPLQTDVGDEFLAESDQRYFWTFFFFPPARPQTWTLGHVTSKQQ